MKILFPAVDAEIIKVRDILCEAILYFHRGENYERKFYLWRQWYKITVDRNSLIVQKENKNV